MLRFQFQKPEGDTAKQLIDLSRAWVEEDCSFGMIENTQSDLHEPLVVALDGERIVGYIFGHFFSQERKISYIEIGERCFEIDELYVLPQYRGQGIGKRLFRMLEDHVKADCQYITLATSTKNYKAILKLYVEELGMCFHSAFLIKQTESDNGEGT